jgi:lycopene cyclase domain-containing protein
LNPRYTYFLLMLFTVAGPLLFSFEKRTCYYRQWKYLAIPLILTGAYFILWDAWFTREGIWSFNDRYILGYKLLYLPVEEWMFFICVPFSCIFIYEAVHRLPQLPKRSAYRINAIFLAVVFIAGLLNLGKAYTAFNFLSAAAFLACIQFILKPEWLGTFYIGYFFSLLPFFMVNGMLTALPVVRYNDAENLGIRIGTIPVEDTVYCLLLLLMNITLYEWMKRKNA